MSLQDAKRLLQWKVVTEALTEAGVDVDTIAMVESARATNETVHLIMQTLMAGSDTKQAKNYVKVDMVGLIAPFERAYIELTRPGGKTSHELREMMRARLHHVRELLSEREPTDALCDSIVLGIDETLAAEAP